MSRRLEPDEITRQLADLPGWHVLRGALHARYDSPDFRSAAALVADVAEVAEEMDHHPDVDLRWKFVRFELSTHSEGGITQLDVELAHRISDAAARLAADPTDDVPSRAEVAVDTTDAGAVREFWRVGLGLSPDEDRLTDPQGLLPTVWFQPSDARPGRGRLHVDVYLPSALARGRVDAVIAAGGTLVTDVHAPAWWVLADRDGNEICVCTDADDPDPA